MRQLPSPPKTPVPPWVVYPGNDPTWSGWRQGTSGAWLLEVWLPFWTRLNEGQRREFLELYPPPDDQWRWYLTEVWT